MEVAAEASRSPIPVSAFLELALPRQVAQHVEDLHGRGGHEVATGDRHVRKVRELPGPTGRPAPDSPTPRKGSVVRTHLPVGTALGALLLLTACGTGTEPAATPPAPPASVAPSSAAPTATPPTSAGTTIDITYAGGEISGDTGRIDLDTGEQVTLTVTSDVAEQVHVHGVDLYIDLEPGTPATTTFAQQAPGVYEVELHDAGTVLTRLQVS